MTGRVVGTIGHGAQAIQSVNAGVTSLANSYDQYQQGKYLEAAKGLAIETLGVVGGARSGLTSAKMLSGQFDPVTMRRLKPGENSVYGCFAAGTPIPMSFGALAIGS